jgi:hypothetical protein
VVLVGLTSVACLGFGAALVLAGSDSKPVETTTVSGEITICHGPLGNPNNLQMQSHTAKSILEINGHIEHPFDIIPSFDYTVIVGTVTTPTSYAGKNLDTLYPVLTTGSRFTGTEVLSTYKCSIPPETTTTTPVKLSETTLPVAITEPGPTITSPGTTTVETVTEMVVVPPTTTTAPATSTVVTVPPGSTETVTVPERTVTVPPSTETIKGETIVRPAETVTLPATTETVTGGATETVATVTGPDKVVQPGDHATKEVVVTVTTPSKTVQEPAHVVPVPEHRITGDTLTETVPTSTTEPATTITLPGTTTTKTTIERLTVPATTVTVPPAETVVTVPPGSTTTVTLPQRTDTVPSSTETINGEVVVRKPETVTLPATTETLTGSATSTVATVTGPNTVVEGGSVATKRALVTATTPSQTVVKPAHVVQAEEEKLIVIVVHKESCPPGTALYHGTCTHTGLGKG